MFESGTLTYSILIRCSMTHMLPAWSQHVGYTVMCDFLDTYSSFTWCL